MYLRLFEKLTIIAFYPLIGMFAYSKAVIGKEISMFILLPIFVYVFINLLISLYSYSYTYKLKVSNIFNIYKIWLLIIFVVSILVGLFIAGITGAKSIIVSYGMILVFSSVSIFCFFIIYRNSQSSTRIEMLINYISISLFLYVLINVLGALLGIENPLFWEQYTREIKSLSGFTEYRVHYPFTFSGQYFSIEAGITSIFGVVWWLNKVDRSAKFFGVTMVLVGMIGMLGHSARLPIIAFVFISSIYYLWNYGGRRILKPLLIIQVMFVPLIAYGVLGELLEYLFGGISYFSRNDGDIGSLSGRNIIWKAGLDHMLNTADLSNLLIGYGAFGQVVSGISMDYIHLFSGSYVETETSALHNSLLQYFVDFGLIGLSILVTFLYVVINSYLYWWQKCKNGTNIKINKLGVLLFSYILLCAITETIISYYSIGIFSIVVIFSLLSFIRFRYLDVK